MGVAAQNASQGTAPADCPKAVDVQPAQMLGLWRAQFEGLPQGATVLLEKNASHGDSFSGAINRDGRRSLLAGDLEDGEFTLEESADGVGISATWIGDVVEGSCGREVRGSWQAMDEKLARPFVLRKLP